MKNICLIIMLFAGFVMNAQSFGSTALEVKGTYEAARPIEGQWLRQGKSARVTMQFAQTPNGLSDAMTLVERILLENNMSFDDPDIYRSVEGKDIINNNNNRNPETMHNSIQKGSSKINLAWNSPDGSVLQLFLGSNSYEVTVMNAYK
jgi:hypothetical protein